MEADPRFADLDKRFWANVRSISEALGYTTRGDKTIKTYSHNDIKKAMKKLDLNIKHLEVNGIQTEISEQLVDYFIYRAATLNQYVEPRLMDVQRAEAAFTQMKNALNPACPIPMNKQKGEKKAPAYLTGLVNMIIEANSGAYPCDYDPRRLTTFTRSGSPLRTMARRVDGCFPSCVNPIAVWEIKEYYYTTTFGSRVADGVYETLLDGMELEELFNSESIDVKHLMMVDSHYTWWECGRSYLCRMIDMLNMGYVDEILFGYEIIERLPFIVKEWVKLSQVSPH